MLILRLKIFLVIVIFSHFFIKLFTSIFRLKTFHRLLTGFFTNLLTRIFHNNFSPISLFSHFSTQTFSQQFTNTEFFTAIFKPRIFLPAIQICFTSIFRFEIFSAISIFLTFTTQNFSHTIPTKSTRQFPIIERLH